MYSSKIKILICAVMSAMIINSALAQSIKKRNGKPVRNYSFVLYAGGGLSGYVATINTQPIGLQTNITKNSLFETLRIMWHPNHRLRVGIETGFTNFYSYALKNGTTAGNVKLTGIPILMVWSVKIVNRVNLFAGFGSYLLTTHLNYDGTVKSTTLSLGSSVAVNYVQPVSKKLGIAIEGKWLNAFQTKDNMLALQILLAWKFLEY